MVIKRAFRTFGIFGSRFPPYLRQKGREEKLDSLSPQLNADRYFSKNRNFVIFFLEVKLSAERNTIFLLSGPKETKLIFSKCPLGRFLCTVTCHAMGLEHVEEADGRWS